MLIGIVRGFWGQFFILFVSFSYCYDQYVLLKC
uniref:Uncharacterized protein n=1 Tax=Arundo donax TaxID=35708 RepID=A0A0A9GZS8_ARUDO